MLFVSVSSTGKLLTEWVKCPNIACKKWMHIQCLQFSDYVCGLCSAFDIDNSV